MRTHTGFSEFFGTFTGKSCVFAAGPYVFLFKATFIEGAECVMASNSGLIVPILQELAARKGMLTAAEAARLAHRSVSRLRHVFTAEMGISFRKARLQARVSVGRSLLVETNLSIPNISDRLNYADRTKFEKSFKRIYGVTPSQYRQQHTSGSSSI